MSEQGGEGQVPESPEPEGKGGLPPRPTVRESVRRGLFVRLPSESDAEEGVAGTEQAAESGEGIADQYPEQVADPYPGWRQAADGSWEAVGPEAYQYSESAEATPPASYSEPDESANYASVAGGEPFIHEETNVEEPTWTYTSEQEVPQAAEETVVPVTPQAPEVVSGVMPEVEPEIAAETVEEAPVPEWPAPSEAASETVAEEATAEVAEVPQAAEAESEEAPAFEPAVEAEATPSFEPEVGAEVAPAVEETPEATEATPAVTPEALPQAASEAAVVAAEDPVAAAGLYIPADVELLEEDMPLFDEKDNVPPRFAGQGLGEPYFVEFGDLGKTLAGLRSLLPKGTRLTYNYDFERAWIRSSEGIDLPSFVERINATEAESEPASS
jgi:hypothetical protein